MNVLTMNIFSEPVIRITLSTIRLTNKLQRIPTRARYKMRCAHGCVAIDLLKFVRSRLVGRLGYASVTWIGV